MLNKKSLVIREAQSKDIESVKFIEIECKLSSWSLSDYSDELNRTDSIFMIAEIDSKTVGFLLARLITIEQIGDNISEINNCNDQINKNKNECEIELYNIGVLATFRRYKIGHRLIKNLIVKAKQFNARAIFLEVRKLNFPAKAFYRKNQFVDIYERKNLYSNPSDDGLGMKLDLSILDDGLDMKCL